MAVTWKKVGFYSTLLTVEEQEIVGRLTGGDLDGIAIGIADNNMVQVDGTINNGEYLKATANGAEGKTFAEVASDISSSITALGAVGTKATPVNADKVLQRNSAASDALVTSTWTQIKAFLKTYWDTLYEALGAVATHAGLTTGVHGVGAGTIGILNKDKTIQDADTDTKIQVEKSADEDIIRMDVVGIEAFLLHNDGILTLAKQSDARAYKDGTQSIAIDTNVLVELDTIDFDQNSEFDTSAGNYCFTAKQAGIYLISTCVTFIAAEIGERYQVMVQLNGATQGFNEIYAAGTYRAILPFLTCIDMAIGDVITLLVFHTSAVAKNIGTDNRYVWMAVTKLA